MTLKKVGCLSMSTIGKRLTITAVCVHVHMSDNKGTLCEAEHSWLPVDVEYMETFLDYFGFACMWRGGTIFRDNLFHPSARLQKVNRWLNIFDELCDAECIALN